MAAPFEVGMTPDITVEGAYIIRFTALDASTGNLVAGVKINSAAIIARDLVQDAEFVINNVADPLLIPT